MMQRQLGTSVGALRLTAHVLAPRCCGPLVAKRHYALNVVPLTKPKKEKQLMSFPDALTFLRCYAIPTPSRRAETLEVQMVLGATDKKKKQRQILRGNVVLPSATGKKKRVLVLSEQASDLEAARKAGADEVGGSEILDKIVAGSIAANKYDVIIASTSMANTLKPAAKVLRAMMPAAKRGTLVDNVGEAVTKFKNSVQFKSDSFGLCNAGVGKLDFTDEALRENIAAFINAIKEQRPADSRGKLIEKFYLKSTRGPSVRVNVAEFE